MTLLVSSKNFRLFSFCSECCQKQTYRNMSAQEAVSALRPFYLVVHPDLFGKYPEAQLVNENSLKQLNGYLQSCAQQHIDLKTPLSPTKLTFYIKKDKSVDQQTFPKSLKVVNLYLNPHQKPLKVVKDILGASGLSSSHLLDDDVDEFSSRKINWSELYNRYKKNPKYENSTSTFEEEVLKNFKTRVKPTIKGMGYWIPKLIDESVAAMKKYDEILGEVSLLRLQFAKDYNVVSVTWNGTWSIAHFLGSMKILQRLLASHRHIDSGATVRICFSNFTRVAADGVVHLSQEDTPETWLRCMSNNRIAVANSEIESRKLERRLSALLNHATIATNCDAELMAYKSWLQNLVTALERTVNLRSTELSSIVLQVVDTLDSIAIDKRNAVVLVPHTVDVKLLWDFLLSNFENIVSQSQKLQAASEELHHLAAECKDAIGLKTISWDDSLSAADLVLSMRRLLGCTSLITVLSGVCLHFSNKYGVSDTGLIMVPLEWFE